MPFEFKPFEPPPINNLRERLLKEQARRLSEHKIEATLAVQAKLRASLSPVEARLNAQYLQLIEGAEQRFRDQLALIERQNVAARETNERLRRLSPLERERNRDGFYRSGQDRTAAILGILDRERRRSAPLTREAYARAEAIAASRRLYDPLASELRGQRGYGYMPSKGDIVPSVDYDPCVEYRASQKVRREVMFAKSLAGRGYRTSHRRSPC